MTKASDALLRRLNGPASEPYTGGEPSGRDLFKALTRIAEGTELKGGIVAPGSGALH